MHLERSYLISACFFHFTKLQQGRNRVKENGSIHGISNIMNDMTNIFYLLGHKMPAN